MLVLRLVICKATEFEVLNVSPHRTEQQFDKDDRIYLNN